MGSAARPPAGLMKTRRRLLLVGLAFAILLVTAFLIGHREEPVYQGKPLSYWVTRLGSDELHGARKDAVEAIRAIGPKAVPYLLEWMPHGQPRRPPWLERSWQWCLGWLHLRAAQKQKEAPGSFCIECAWWALGTEGKSAIPSLARVINQPPRAMHNYSAWTASATAISYLGPDAIAPMLAAATNMQGLDELWELIKNFENLGTNGAPAVPALIQWTNHPYYFVRAGLATALGGIGKRPDLAVPALLAGLHDSNSMVRRDAANALGAFADDSDAVLPELIKTLNGDDREARGGALSGLGRIRTRPETVVPLIAPYLSDEKGSSAVARSAAYALRDLGSQVGYRALLLATNAPSDIAYLVVETLSKERSQEEEKRYRAIMASLSRMYARGEVPRLSDLEIAGRRLSQLLSNEANADAPLRLDQMLTLRPVSTAGDDETATFELPLSYDALTNIGTLRLLCDADPNERAGNEALVQECQRATNGYCHLVWDTSFDPPGRHFLQAEIIIYKWHGHSAQRNQEIPLKGPLFSFLSTNAVQSFPGGDVYNENGAFFHVKLAQQIGDYSLELTTPSGEHIHTINGSTTNGIVDVHWDLLYADGQRYTNDSFNSSWSVTFPNSPKPPAANAARIP
jgi:HEAT repeat protein